MVELRHLRYFIAVAEELNFSRAAERMHMAQPPLSAAIRQLERDLGVDLFVRTTREVRLTDAGRAFLQGARRTLADAERAAEDAKRAAAGELGHLRIAYSWSTRFAAPKSPPSSSSPRHARSAWSRSFRWHIGWRMRRRSRCRRGYLNYMQADEPIERVRAAFGDEAFGRLQALKRRYDPNNVLRRNQNIPPLEPTVVEG
jgi:hypothetical protein